MAITYQATSGDLVTIQPDDPRGPWTIELPDPSENAANNGWFVVVKATGFGETPVTITALGTASIEDANLAEKASSVALVFVANAIEFTYNQVRNSWQVYRAAAAPVHTAILAGAPDSIGNNETLVNWDTAGESEFFDDGAADLTAGTITVPAAGLYIAQTHVFCTQSNSNKEFTILLRMDRSISGNIDIGAFQVATDKTPRYRVFPFISYVAFAAGDVVSLSLRAEGGDSYGTLSFDNCSFSISRSILTPPSSRRLA